MNVPAHGRSTTLPQAVPVVIDDHTADLAHHDYADSFEMRLPGTDLRSAEEWVRSGLEEAPAVVRALIRLVHRRVLGFDLAPDGARGHILGWRVVDSEWDALRITAESDLGRGVIVAQRPDPTSVLLQTFLFYRRPAAARRLWVVVGPLHRTIAPLLMSRAARRAGQPSRSGRTFG